MRDDEIRRLLTLANPWWRAAAAGADPVAWQGDHRLLRERDRYDLGYRSDILADIASEPVADALVVLTGPRRVGKSVVLLDTAAALCGRSDLSPWQVIHLPCDGMSERDLRRALTLARDLTRPADQPQARRRVWLLDEVGTVVRWTAVLKAARDATDFGDDTVVATGSRWNGREDVEGNLLAGRAGAGPHRRHRQLMPMTFGDFVTYARPELVRLRPVGAHRLMEPGTARTLDEVAFDVDAYDLAWQSYLECGGFPRAVAEHVRSGAVSIAYARDLAAWLRRDIDPDAAPESVPLLLDVLAHRETSPLNLSDTAERLGSTRAALDVRIRRLLSSYAAVVCHRRDHEGLAVARAQYKLYLTDPLQAHLPHLLRAGLPAPDATRLTEAAVGTHLARFVDLLDEGRWVAGDTVGFLRSAAGAEVDFASLHVPTAAGPARTVPLETKWVDTGWRGESRALGAAYGTGIIATKSVLVTSGEIWAVPAPLLCQLVI